MIYVTEAIVIVISSDLTCIPAKQACASIFSFSKICHARPWTSYIEMSSNLHMDIII